jgi:hydrogenase nickel incorporation protein HypB
MTTRIALLRRGILKKNDELAAVLRDRYSSAGVMVLNLVSSPGTGKTAFLERTLTELKSKGARVAALVGDLETDNDARRLASSGAPVRQINTHGICHLDAEMIDKHLEGWELDDLDFLFIENVGNLVCPSSYDLGEKMRVALLSVTEGEDKPLKYPAMFNSADAAVITKIDLAEPCGFDRELALKNIREIRPGIRIFETSAKTGAGMKEWLNYLVVEAGSKWVVEEDEAAVPSRRKPGAEVQGQARTGRAFETVKEAKEFLIDWIDAEARRVGSPLTEMERKMLFVSEKGWTLPDMAEVQAAFYRYHDLVEYEDKVGKLIRGIQASVQAGNKDEAETWRQAVQVLSREDHYWLELMKGSGEVVRRRRSHLLLWLGVVLVAVALAALAIVISHHFGGSRVYAPPPTN